MKEIVSFGQCVHASFIVGMNSQLQNLWMIPQDGARWSKPKTALDFSSPDPKASGELLGWDSSRRAYVRAFTFSNMNISEISWPMVIKFHLEHQKNGGLAVLCFRARSDQNSGFHGNR